MRGLAVVMAAAALAGSGAANASVQPYRPDWSEFMTITRETPGGFGPGWIVARSGYFTTGVSLNRRDVDCSAYAHEAGSASDRTRRGSEFLACGHATKAGTATVVRILVSRDRPGWRHAGNIGHLSIEFDGSLFDGVTVLPSSRVRLFYTVCGSQGLCQLGTNASGTIEIRRSQGRSALVLLDLEIESVLWGFDHGFEDGARAEPLKLYEQVEVGSNHGCWTFGFSAVACT